MSRHQEFRVTDADGVVGRLLTTSRFLDDNPHRLIRLADGRELLLPKRMLTPQEDGSFHVNASFAELLGDNRGGLAPEPSRGDEEQESHYEEDAVLPVMEEQLNIEKRVIESGRIRVHKKVETTESVVDEPLLHQGYDIERIPLNRVVDGMPESRYDGDTLILPILEEVLVVEKRLILKEEVRITPKREEVRDPQTHTVRREHAEVERV
jgi:uncharacterized protein (TIGR02271 family)